MSKGCSYKYKKGRKNESFSRLNKLCVVGMHEHKSGQMKSPHSIFLKDLLPVFISLIVIDTFFLFQKKKQLATQ